jgi:hypothetical protein
MSQAITGDAAAVLASHVATGTVPEPSRRAAARLALDTIGAAIGGQPAAGLPEELTARIGENDVGVAATVRVGVPEHIMAVGERDAGTVAADEDERVPAGRAAGIRLCQRQHDQDLPHQARRRPRSR